LKETEELSSNLKELEIEHQQVLDEKTRYKTESEQLKVNHIFFFSLFIVLFFWLFLRFKGISSADFYEYHL